MTGAASKEVDARELGPWHNVGLCSLIAWVAVTVASAVVDGRAAAGTAVGGTVGLGLFFLHRSLAGLWQDVRTRRRACAYLWVVWVLKWPLVGSLLYVAIKSGRASPVWICVGAALVPATATLIALWSVLLDNLRRPARTEAG